MLGRFHRLLFLGSQIPVLLLGTVLPLLGSWPLPVADPSTQAGLTDLAFSCTLPEDV